MRTVKVPCLAEKGLFSDELIITLKTEKGGRQFFISKSNYTPKTNGRTEPPQFTGYVNALVLRQDGPLLTLSIPGEPADLFVSKIWMKNEDVFSTADE